MLDGRFTLLSDCRAGQGSRGFGCGRGRYRYFSALDVPKESPPPPVPWPLASPPATVQSPLQADAPAPGPWGQPRASQPRASQPRASPAPCIACCLGAILPLNLRALRTSDHRRSCRCPSNLPISTIFPIFDSAHPGAHAAELLPVPHPSLPALHSVILRDP
eukprot:scaffold27689_cov100-Isochrysis_galbana.AAC.3